MFYHSFVTRDRSLFIHITIIHFFFFEGDVFALSASTPKHLENVGLLSNYETDKEAKINQLYQRALREIVHLPLAISLEQYRWALFRGEIKPDEYNSRYWQMHANASGVTPPVQRSETDFDPPSIFHVSTDIEYLRWILK